ESSLSHARLPRPIEEKPPFLAFSIDVYDVSGLLLHSFPSSLPLSLL
ncbi:unnamed protein product, partial [Musa acuminata subsp. malaccensis]